MRLILRAVAVAAITGFWAVMWGLLIRSEVRPGETALREVPLELVFKRVFQHEQASELYLRERGESIGHLRIAPRRTAEGFAFQLVGAMENTPAKGERLRTGFDALLQLDAEYHLADVRVSFTSRAVQPSPQPVVVVEFTGNTVTQQGWYRYTQSGTIMAEQSFSLDEAGVGEVLQQWGISPDVAKQAPALSGGKLEVAARLTRFMLRDFPVDATVVTVKAAGQTWLEIYLNQIGQVLRIKTLWGWTLEGE